MNHSKKSVQKIFLFGTVFFCAVTLLFPMRVKAGSTFIHTHSESCIRTQTIPCDYPHESYSSHEIITRHCTYCGGMTSHSHYLTNYKCGLTGYCKTTAGSTACLTCHNAGYAWQDPNGFAHNREEQVYICGVNESEAVARVTLSADTTSLTNRDIVLGAGVEVIHGALAGSGFSYSWDGSTWSAGTTRNVSQNGTYTVWVQNAFGEVAEASVTVSNIDKTAPVISGISHDTNGMTKEKIRIVVSATDENGIAAYSFDGGTTWQEEGNGWIYAGRSTTVVVKDKAGNTASREVKREQFPVPYEAPAVKPSADTPQSGKKPDTVQDTKKESTFTGTKTSSNAGKDKKQTGGSSDKTIQDKGKQTPEKSNSSSDTGLVPKITVSQNWISGYERNNCISEQSEKETEVNADTERKPESTEEAGLSPAEEEAEWAQKQKWNRSQSKGSIFTLGATALIALAAGGFFYFFLFRTGVLYEMKEVEGEPYFRRLRRVRIQKTEKGYETVLPKDLQQFSYGGHFRILLPERWIKGGRNQQIFIYSGQRKLVADVEECIDFVL